MRSTAGNKFTASLRPRNGWHDSGSGYSRLAGCLAFYAGYDTVAQASLPASLNTPGWKPALQDVLFLNQWVELCFLEGDIGFVIISAGASRSLM